MPKADELREALREWKPKALKESLDECGVDHKGLLEKAELVAALERALINNRQLLLRVVTFCEICCRWLRTEEMWPLTCSHLVCEMCLGRHLGVEAEKMLKHAKRHALPCLYPECKTPIPLKTAEEFCQRVRGIWSDLSTRERLLKHAKYPVVECPRPQCVGVAYVEPGRRDAMCFLCEQQWQVNDAADTTADAQFSTGVRSCPKCSAPIEKNHGCDHMHCTKCGRDFSWTQAVAANPEHRGRPNEEGGRGNSAFRREAPLDECVVS